MGVTSGSGLLVVWLVVDVATGESDTSRVVAMVGVRVKIMDTRVVVAVNS